MCSCYNDTSLNNKFKISGIDCRIIKGWMNHNYCSRVVCITGLRDLKCR